MDYLKEFKAKIKKKRLFVKYCRDAAKGLYPKEDYCYITGETKNLEYHHYISVAQLANIWMEQEGLSEKLLDTEGKCMYHRERFIGAHIDELYSSGVTLTKEWHKKLHSIYGVSPAPSTSKKQERWVNLKRDQQ